MSFVFANGAAEQAAAADPNDFHVGIVTGTVSQSEDDLRGAEALLPSSAVCCYQYLGTS